MEKLDYFSVLCRMISGEVVNDLDGLEGDHCAFAQLEMNNSNASKSASNSTNNSITSDTLSNQHSPVCSNLWEGENTFAAPCQPPSWGFQPPQYSWRRKATPDAPYGSPLKEDLSLDDLLRKKSYLLQNIAQNYSRLVGLMQEELVCSPNFKFY